MYKCMEDIQKLQEQEAFLRNSIARLGVTLEQLDMTVKNHDGHLMYMQNSEKEKEEINTELIALKSLEVSLNEKINILTNKKNSLEKDISNFQTVAEQRDSLLKEIEKLTKHQEILQSDTETFINNHAGIKKTALENKDKITQQLKNVHDVLSQAINLME